MTYALIYLITVNVVAFLLMLSDKHRAIKKYYRIPERVLIGAAVIGGSFGSLLGMKLLHHKTRHIRFRWGLPMILALHICIAFLIYLFIFA